MAYIICASPLAKIFQPELQPYLLADPSLIEKESEFVIKVKRPMGDLKFIYKKPKFVQNDRDPSDSKALIEWLTCNPGGIWTEETNIYGLVRLNMDADFFAATAQIDHMNALISGDPEAKKRAEEDNRDLMQNVQSRMITEIKSARLKADERVMNALKRNYNNLMKQITTNLESGLGKPMPSDTEMLGSEILAADIAKATKSRQKMVERFNANVNKIIG